MPPTEHAKELPDKIHDPKTGIVYIKGKFLGKGGFAKCYEFIDPNLEATFAGKVVSKSLLTKQHQKDKMTQEIEIHRSLSHKNVVAFRSCFEDLDNVYIVLELCRKRSLMELHKRRRAVSEIEGRYFTKQIVEATQYLHRNRIIHRDLKLGNLFLNDEMSIKVGDFGLATRLTYDEERKKTLCGTPNYIAPEMLRKQGHGYEVDIWAIGCVLYTLIIGKPPFETSSLRDTYARIKRNEYHVPSRISECARDLIKKLLHAEPKERPIVDEILNFSFFKGYCPTRLPTSCLTMAPKFNRQSIDSTRPPLIQTNVNGQLYAGGDTGKARGLLPAIQRVPLRSVAEGETLDVPSTATGRPISTVGDEECEIPRDLGIASLLTMLNELLTLKPSELLNIQQEEALDPAATPIFWISKWVDYSDKYGLGYQLSDNSVGVLFNDNTKLVLNRNDEIQYIDKDNAEQFHDMQDYPEDLAKKITLGKYFRNYMNEHLLKAGASHARFEGDELIRLPCLRTWFRTRSAIVLHLSNGTLQINFFQDHTKLILCPFMKAVTFIDEDKNFKTYRLDTLGQFGCSSHLCTRLRYAKTMVERVVAHKSTALTGKTFSGTSAVPAGGSTGVPG